MVDEDADGDALGARDARQVGGLAEPVVQQRGVGVEGKVEHGPAGRDAQSARPHGAAEQHEGPQTRQPAHRRTIGAARAHAVGPRDLRQHRDTGIIQRSGRTRGGDVRGDRAIEADRTGTSDRMPVLRRGREGARRHTGIRIGQRSEAGLVDPDG